MKTRLLVALAALVLVQTGSIAVAGAQGPEASPPDEGEIVVTGGQLRRMVWDFVDVASTTPNHEDQLARWDQRICPGIVGVAARQGQFIVDRMAQRAAALGLRVGEPGCRANVLVLVTREADEMAQALVEHERFLMADYGMQEHLGTRGEEALQDFVSTPRPVRWWHVAQSTTQDGRVLRNVGYSGGAFDSRARKPSFEIIRNARASRLLRNIRQDFRNVLIIVDAQRARGPTLEALADYLAMTALAQLDPGADTSTYPTILNLFADAAEGRPPPARMTEWDVAYLEGLYRARRNAPNSQSQARDIRRQMVEDLTPAD